MAQQTLWNGYFFTISCFGVGRYRQLERPKINVTKILCNIALLKVTWDQMFRYLDIYIKYTYKHIYMYVYIYIYIYYKKVQPINIYNQYKSNSCAIYKVDHPS